MGIFEDSLEGSMLSIGRNPEWQNPAFPETASLPDPSLLPETAINGKDLRNSPKCLVWFAPRELIHAHGSRVRVTTVDDTDTYTVTLGGVNDLDHDYAASGGDLATGIIDGLATAINDGVDLVTLGGDTLAFVDNSPLGDTIVRTGAGSFVTDGIAPGDTVTLTGTANNDVTYTVAAVVALTLTLVTTDAVFVEAGQSVTAFVVQRPVVASNELRDTVVLGVTTQVATLVITHAKVHTEFDDPANTFTTAVSTTLAGVLEFDEDASGGDITLYLTAGGTGAAKPAATQWILARNGAFASITYVGLTERVDTAGFGRIYPQLTNLTSPTPAATITYTLKVAPAIVE